MSISFDSLYIAHVCWHGKRIHVSVFTCNESLFYRELGYKYSCRIVKYDSFERIK